MAIDSSQKEYICPGERHPISRSVHLARLASAFAACRECPCRIDAPHVALRIPHDVATSDAAVDVSGSSEQLDHTAGERDSQTARARARGGPGSPRDVFLTEGVRGIFLNEVTRPLAETIAGAFGVYLWEQAPLAGPNDGVAQGARHARPTVVVGYDERGSSPSIFASVAAGLTRMGCHLIEIGLVTKPCLSFAVHHLHASGGVFITGAGGEPSCTGLDFLSPGSRPLSLGSGLERVRELTSSPAGRPTRSPGTRRVFQSIAVYEAARSEQFNGLRPLKVVCASPSVILRRTIERLFQSLPCELVAVDVPCRVRNPVQRRDADVLRLSSAVRDGEASVGVLIDDDGERCGFVDDRGRHLSPAAIARLLALPLLAKHSRADVLLEPGAFAELRPLIEAMGGQCQRCPETFAEVAKALERSNILYAGGDSGRHWFPEPFPDCDALLVLSKVLAALSQAHVPLSELARS